MWHPKNMVQVGGSGGGPTFPHPPSAFHLPAPSPPAVSQLTGSWDKGAPPRFPPPEAQGARGDRPEAPPFGPLSPPLLPNFSRRRQVKEVGQGRV